MKRKMISFLTSLLVVTCILSISACSFVFPFFEKKEGNENEDTFTAFVAHTEANLVVIKVETAEKDVTLMQVMNALQEKEELSFAVSEGMINAINGVSNDTVTWAHFWALYTSDSELSNTEWGTVE